MIPAKIDQLFLSNMGFCVTLKTESDPRSVPIFIGAAEAQAIAIQMQNIHPPRPLTHDLLKNVMDCLECRLQRIEIWDIKEGTFYGRLIVEMNGENLQIDCRPSDAIALALRAAAPIFVEEKVIEESGRVLDAVKSEEEPEPREPARSGPKMTRKSPVEILEATLEKAIREERYEEAAKIRDQIAELKKHRHN